MPEWQLKHKVDLRFSILRHYTRKDRENIETSWSLDRGKRVPKDPLDRGWDSSDDSVIEEDGVHDVDRYYNMSYSMDLLGLHPNKEIIFLGDFFDGFAYYLGSSKLQYLGTFYPTKCWHSMVAAAQESFIYTPCMDDLLPNEGEDLEELVDTDEDGDLEEEVETNEDEYQEEEVDTDEDEYLEEEEKEEEVVGIDEDKVLEKEVVGINEDNKYLVEEEVDSDEDEDEGG
jgi:hypothetical protein